MTKDQQLRQGMRVLIAIARRALPADDPLVADMEVGLVSMAADGGRASALAAIRLLAALQDDTAVRARFTRAMTEMQAAVQPMGRA